VLEEYGVREAKYDIINFCSYFISLRLYVLHTEVLRMEYSIGYIGNENEVCIPELYFQPFFELT